MYWEAFSMGRDENHGSKTPLAFRVVNDKGETLQMGRFEDDDGRGERTALVGIKEMGPLKNQHEVDVCGHEIVAFGSI